MLANQLIDFFRPQAAIKMDPQRFQTLYVPRVAGIKLRPMEALQLSAVWACMMVITNAIASSRRKVVLVSEANQIQEIPRHNLNYILNTRANVDMTSIAWMESMFLSALPWGNGYSEIVKTNGGQIAELWPLPADAVELIRDEGGQLWYEFRSEKGDRLRIHPERMFHMRGPSLSGLLGDSLVMRAARTMANSVAAERFSGNFFNNGTVLSGVLKYSKSLSPATKIKLQESWASRYRGPDQAFGTPVLEDGVEYEPIVIDAQKSQMVETRRFQVEEIARWFGVPPHKIQSLERSTFNNIEHLGIEFVRDALRPWKLRFEQEADYKLFAPRDPKTVLIDTNWLAHGDAKSRAEYYQIMRRIGVYSVNDVLRDEGRNTIGNEGDTRMIEQNMQSLDALTAPVSEVDDSEDRVFDIACSAIGNSLARYQRKMVNRRSDLQRQRLSDKRIMENLVSARDDARNRLFSECQDICNILAQSGRGEVDYRGALASSADAVDAGVSPDKEAKRLIGVIAE